jgi:hypothetical protein
MFRIDREPMTPLRRRYIDDLRLRNKSPRKVLAWRRTKWDNAVDTVQPYWNCPESASTQPPTGPYFR